MTPSVPVSPRGVVAKSYTRSMEVASTLACLPSLGLAALIYGWEGAGGAGRQAGGWAGRRASERKDVPPHCISSCAHCSKPAGRPVQPGALSPDAPTVFSIASASSSVKKKSPSCLASSCRQQQQQQQARWAAEGGCQLGASFSMLSGAALLSQSLPPLSTAWCMVVSATARPSRPGGAASCLNTAACPLPPFNSPPSPLPPPAQTRSCC
jgi:hypothetical protein